MQARFTLLIPFSMCSCRLVTPVCLTSLLGITFSLGKHSISLILMQLQRYSFYLLFGFKAALIVPHKSN